MHVRISITSKIEINTFFALIDWLAYKYNTYLLETMFFRINNYFTISLHWMLDSKQVM